MNISVVPPKPVPKTYNIEMSQEEVDIFFGMLNWIESEESNLNKKILDMYRSLSGVVRETEYEVKGDHHHGVKIKKEQ